MGRKEVDADVEQPMSHLSASGKSLGAHFADIDATSQLSNDTRRRNSP